MAIEEVTHSEVRRLFRFDEHTGNLVWRERPLSDFKTQAAHKRFNTARAGCTAGCISHGYVLVFISGRPYYGHRLVWLYKNGEWPRHSIDHINGDKSDNRLCNLRDVPHSENMKNKPMDARNTSGVNGVTWDKSKKMWVVTGPRGWPQRRYKVMREAVRARKDLETKLRYHKNHGR